MRFAGFTFLNQIEIIKHEAPEFGLVFNVSDSVSCLWKVFFPIEAFGEIIPKYISVVVEVEIWPDGRALFVTLAKARV